MKSLDAQALILAVPGAVWDVLTDAGNYDVWDSGITAFRGELRHGGTVRIRTLTSGRKTLRFRVSLIPGRSMTWTRRLPLRLGTITRTVTLSDHGAFTYLDVCETSRGVLPGLKRGTPAHSVQVMQGFIEAVKFRAELVGHHLHGGTLAAPQSPEPRLRPPEPSLRAPVEPARASANAARHVKGRGAASVRKTSSAVEPPAPE